MLLASNRSIARSLKSGDRKNINLGNIYNLVYININLNHPNCSLLFHSISLSLPAESMKKIILLFCHNKQENNSLPLSTLKLSVLT